MKRNILYLALGLWCIGFTACTHDSDEPNPVLKNELSRSTITVERTVTLTAPGTLQEKVEEAMAGEDVSTLQKLTIVGPYSTSDIEYWKTALTNLIEFDLKQAIPIPSEYADSFDNIPEQWGYRIDSSSFIYMDKLETIIFPDCVTRIEDQACYGCTNLKFVQFGENLNCINYNAFGYCGFKTITIPKSVVNWGSHVFQNCIELENVEFLPEISKIEACLFNGCSKLNSITLSSTINIVGDASFYGCTSLKDFPFSQINTIEYDAFYNCGFEVVDLSNVTDFTNARSSFAYCGLLRKVILSDNVTYLPEYMFYGCRNLKEINIPSSLETISNSLFRDCGFTEFTIPSNITHIGDYAFAGNLLKSIYVPQTVTTVGDELFNSCHNLQYIKWDSPAELLDYDYVNTNCYVYLDNESIGCGPNWNNVIIKINDEYVAESVVLCDGGQRDNLNWSYSVPIGFKAKKIRYERRFGDYSWQGEYFTHPGECSGWQTIVLPFSPTEIKHETKGIVAPFNSGIEGAKPFWLRELTANGWEDRTTMEANKPYIIAMPNHDSYLEDYRLYGKIIFSAKNVTLEATTDGTSEKVYPASVGPDYDLQPTYHYVEGSPMVYALNTTYPIDDCHYGSVFVKSSSDGYPRYDVYAFEAYVSTAGRLARATFGIDTSSANTRSTKEKNTTGIPQIGDM